MTLSKINYERTSGRTVVVACRVMEPELERVRKGLDHVEIRYLKQVLHRTPKEMAGLVQEQVDQGAYDSELFFKLKPGEKVSQQMYLESGK